LILIEDKMLHGW